MLKLTEKQFELAADAYRSQDGAFTGSVISGLILAAPFLQLPWEYPSGDERYDLFKANRHIVPADMMMYQCVKMFVERRNAQLLPKPVDPRRQRVLCILKGASDHSTTTLELIADSIIAALDEVK